MKKRFHPEFVAVALLLAAHAGLALAGSARVGLTHDEPAHLVAGLYYDLAGDFRFQPENGLLPQRLEALPWIRAGHDLPARSGGAWEAADVWALGDQLVNSAGTAAPALLAWSRAAATLASLALLTLLWAWTRRDFGRPAALGFLALAALCPNLLAHAGLATSETWGALGLVAASLAWWRVCSHLTAGRVLIAGAAAGLLALAKFNCVLLAPIALLLGLLRTLRARPLLWSWRGRSGRLHGLHKLPALAGAGLAAMVLAVAVIWAGYGFRYAASTDPQARFAKSWDTILMTAPQDLGLPQLGEDPAAATRRIAAGPLQQAIALAREARLLPEAWLYGLGFVAYHSHYRLAYFAGEHRTGGTAAYFPLAVLLKTTPGGLAALALGLAAWIAGRRRAAAAWRLAPLLALAAVVTGFALAGDINIGLRHILPVLVVGWLVAAVAVAHLARARRRLWLALLGATALAQAAATLRAWPHQLAYFNFLAGARPDAWFVDSNLDWGQGLPELARWQREAGRGAPLFLSYFGSDAPARHGLAVVRFGDHLFDRAPRQLPAPLTGGWFALGATAYRRVYNEARGPWTAAREELYQRLLRRVATRDLPADTAARELLLVDFDTLRLARLTHWLDRRPADVTLAGGAMLLFRLGDEEVAAALYGPLADSAR